MCALAVLAVTAAIVSFQAQFQTVIVQAATDLLVPSPAASDNSPFSADEQADIAKHLDKIVDYVRDSFELPDGQLGAIAQAMEELKEASERVGRKDRKLLLYGAFVSLGLEHAVQSGVVETLFRLAAQGSATSSGQAGRR